MYLSRQNFILLKGVADDLTGYNAELMHKILEEIQERQKQQNKRMVQTIREARKKNPLYGKSLKEQVSIIAKKVRQKEEGKNEQN